MKANKWNIRKYICRLLACMAAAVVVCFASGGSARIFAAADAPSGKVGDLKQTGATTNSVEIQFGAFLGQDVKYSVRVGSSESNVNTEYASVSTGNAVISGLAAGSTYYVKVVPFYEDDNEMSTDRAYGTASSVISVVTAPAEAASGITQSASSASSVTVTWNGVSGASGYLVDYYLSDGTAQEKISLTTSAAKAELTGLSASKTYTANITAFRKSKEGYMAYDSSVYAVKSGLKLDAVSAGAPSGIVTGFAQKSAAADSAEITFSLPDAAAQYSVQLSQKSDSGFAEYAVVTQGSCTFTELKSGSSYYIRVIPFYQNWNSFNEEYDRVYGTASEAFELVTAPNAKPKTITQTAATKTGFSLTWDAVDGANGYSVDYYQSGSKTQATKCVTKNQVKLTKLAANSEYNVYVTAYRKSASGFIATDESLYTGSFNIPVKPSKAGKATVVKYWQSLGKINIKTKKIACADGYQYALYTAYGDTEKKITTAASESYSSAVLSSAKLKKAAVFKVRVRAYITIEGKKVYGAWSDWTYVSAPDKVTLSKNGSKIHASWTKVKGADRYVVYISTDKESGYKKCFVTTKTSCDISSYGKKSLVAGTKYYVYVVPQVEVDGVYISTSKREAVTEIK